MSYMYVLTWHCTVRFSAPERRLVKAITISQDKYALKALHPLPLRARTRNSAWNEAWQVYGSLLCVPQVKKKNMVKLCRETLL